MGVYRPEAGEISTSPTHFKPHPQTKEKSCLSDTPCVSPWTKFSFCLKIVWSAVVGDAEPIKPASNSPTLLHLLDSIQEETLLKSLTRVLSRGHTFLPCQNSCAASNIDLDNCYIPGIADPSVRLGPVYIKTTVSVKQ